MVSEPGRQPAGQTKIKELLEVNLSTFFFVYKTKIYLLHVYQYIEKLEEVEVFHQLIDQLEDHSL
jgi:hypothetical protein